jgi:hypothetical protein
MIRVTRNITSCTQDELLKACLLEELALLHFFLQLLVEEESSIYIVRVLNLDRKSCSWSETLLNYTLVRLGP